MLLRNGVQMLTKTLALQVADKGIRINAIPPGAIATMMNVDVLQDENKKRRKKMKLLCTESENRQKLPRLLFSWRHPVFLT
jgi:NAD(P)-dependent dehydrogenase (short-subunit alcohol dehydrogenase family)